MDEEKALKTAKKLLKKNESSSMKLKALAKQVADKLGDGENYKKVKKLIEKSDKFSVNGKEVSLSKKKKRDASEADTSAPSKKAKVDKKSDSSSGASPSSIEEWRKENKIVLKHAKDDDEGKEETKKINSNEAYHPLTTFEACKSLIENPLIRQCTEANGFQKPSPIQAQAWPILMHKKRDIVGIAETGSGKTLAFSIPALSSMSKNRPASNRRKPGMLVLSPTRELAMQVEVVLKEYGAVLGMRSLCLYGGVPKYTQTSELRKGSVDIIVATPGRLKDLVNEGSCDLSKIQHLVLDEADRMLDMGFEGKIGFFFLYFLASDKFVDSPINIPLFEIARSQRMSSTLFPIVCQKKMEGRQLCSLQLGQQPFSRLH